MPTPTGYSFEPATGAAGPTGPTGATGATGVLSVLSGVIVGDVVLTAASFIAVFSTASLAVGSWFITMQMCFVPGTASEVAIVGQVNTATATLTGSISAASSGAIQEMLNISFVAVVTVAGTLKLTAIQAGAVNGTAKASSVTEGFTGVTGWTALRFL